MKSSYKGKGKGRIKSMNAKRKNLSLARTHQKKMSEFLSKRTLLEDLTKTDEKTRSRSTKQKICDLQRVIEQEEEYMLLVGDIVFSYIQNEHDEEKKKHYSNLYFYKLGIAPDIHDTFTSSLCKMCNTVLEDDSGYTVCKSCGITRNDIHFSKDLSYKELQEYEHKPRFGYEKMSHLEDWLNRFQAKENRVIPPDVLDMIKLELQKERIVDFKNVSESKVKWYLKKLNLNDYYDNVINILNRISGRPPFILTPEIDEKIKQMFSQIQEPFRKYKPENRKNFLSYSYFLNKFFLMLKLPEFAEYFPLLKSPDKLRQQDEIFKKIVVYMKDRDSSVEWKFFPSF
jgi:hypothetical protein